MNNQITLGDHVVSRVGLGTNKFTGTPEAISLLQYAVQAGINFIDTAYLYTAGASETVIGNALAPYANDLVIATKGGYGSGEGNNQPGYLRANLEESLRRLQTDRITLYQLHRVDAHVPLSQTMQLLKSFQDEGLIELIGLSEVDSRQIEEARKYVQIVSVQNEYSQAERKHEAVLDYCTDNGIAFIPWFPLRNLSNQQTNELTAIAANHGATPEQIALAWLLKRSPQMLPIPGTLSKQHLKENIAAAQINLTDDEYQRLNNTGEQ